MVSAPFEARNMRPASPSWLLPRTLHGPLLSCQEGPGSRMHMSASFLCQRLTSSAPTLTAPATPCLAPSPSEISSPIPPPTPPARTPVFLLPQMASPVISVSDYHPSSEHPPSTTPPPAVTPQEPGHRGLPISPPHFLTASPPTSISRDAETRSKPPAYTRAVLALLSLPHLCLGKGEPIRRPHFSTPAWGLQVAGEQQGGGECDVCPWPGSSSQ